jgi:hypothetical protein
MDGTGATLPWPLVDAGRTFRMRSGMALRD